MKRYVLEGTWSGYRNGQQRVCHRVVTTRPHHYDGITAIVFHDNTTMNLTLRPCHRYEKVKEIHGYDEVLRDAVLSGKKGFIHVKDL